MADSLVVELGVVVGGSDKMERERLSAGRETSADLFLINKFEMESLLFGEANEVPCK